jgi:hypothetical protein
LEDRSVRKSRRLEKDAQRITQTSLGFLLLQSITCWCTGVKPWSRWARGAVVWADSEARVQIAPSGMMKKRRDGFVIFSLLCGAGVRFDDDGFNG